MVENKFTNAEQEYEAHAEYFTNVKFAYRERESKLYFYEKLYNNDDVAVDAKVLQQAKANLKDVKQEYKVRDERMKVLSKEMNELDTEIEELKLKRDNLKKKNELMGANKEKLKVIKNNLNNQNSIKVQLDKARAENAEIVRNMQQMENKLQGQDLEKLLEEEKRLQEKKENLSTKVKRMTIVNTENNMEEIYFWQKALSDFYKNFFGEIKHEVQKDGKTCVLTMFTKREDIEEVKITLYNKKLTDIQIFGKKLELYMETYLKLKELCLMANDPRMFLMYIIILE